MFHSTKHNMSDNSRVSVPLRLTILLLLTIGLVWLMNIFLDQYFFVSGGLPAYIVIGSLLTLMNLIARPILKVILFPFKLIATLPALMAVNAGFLWLTQMIAELMDPEVVTLEIDGGVAGWLLVAVVLGFGNWIFKEVIRS